jgi:hypothetical protein
VTNVQFLPILSAMVIVTFAILVFRRYAHRGGTYLLVWGIGLALFAVVSVAEVYSTIGWHPTVFRLWYLCGAVLAAAWLGQGTVLLLARHRRSIRLLSMTLLIIGSAVAVYLAFTVPLRPARFSPEVALSAQYREILPPGATLRRLTPIFNVYGTMTLVGGALYSAWLLMRREIAPAKVLGNVLIAAGGLSLALASTLVRFGLADYLYLAELIAAVGIFSGFLLSSIRVPVSAPAAAEVGRS